MKGSATTAKSKKQSPVIEYKWRGINCKRAKGKTGKQAPVAKQQAAILGKASAISARIRLAFKPLLGERPNRPLMYRMNNALQKCLRNGEISKTQTCESLPSIDGFCFYGEPNRYEPFEKVTIIRSSGNKVTIGVPGFENATGVNLSPFYGKINIMICAAACDLLDADADYTFKTEIKLTSTDIPASPAEIVIPFSAGPSKLIVVAVAVNKGAAWIAGAVCN